MPSEVVPLVQRPAEPLSNEAAKKLVREILKSGTLAFSQHAKEEMAEDGLQSADIVNVLRAGWCVSAEKEKGTWRYRFKTNRLCVIVAFRTIRDAVVVTAWRDV